MRKSGFTAEIVDNRLLLSSSHPTSYDVQVITDGKLSDSFVLHPVSGLTKEIEQGKVEVRFLPVDKGTFRGVLDGVVFFQLGG